LSLARVVALTAALLMVVVGAAWFGYGNGWFGSAGDEPTWAYLGAVTAGLGLALGIVVVQNRR
jgi:hypothetical protein